MHKETCSNVPFPHFIALTITTFKMQLMRLAFFAALLAPAARADHHTCGWTGPGPGNPTKYGFVQWCITEQAIEHDAAEAETLEGRHHHHTHVPWYRRPHGHDDGPISYYCIDTDKNETKIGDWDKLRTNILELGTPCNDGGFGGDSCESDNWGFCWSESGNLDNISPRGCFYITKYDDCEWPGEVKEDDLPKHIVVVVK